MLSSGSRPKTFARFFEGVVVGKAASLAKARDFIAAHAFLPADPRAVPVQEIEARSRILFDQRAPLQEKRELLVLLAHHGSDTAVRLCAEYAANPDRELCHFAELALEEAALWAGYPAPVPPRGTCPCASGKPFRDCCGRD